MPHMLLKCTSTGQMIEHPCILCTQTALVWKLASCHGDCFWIFQICTQEGVCARGVNRMYVYVCKLGVVSHLVTGQVH